MAVSKKSRKNLARFLGATVFFSGTSAVFANPPDPVVEEAGKINLGENPELVPFDNRAKYFDLFFRKKINSKNVKPAFDSKNKKSLSQKEVVETVKAKFSESKPAENVKKPDKNSVSKSVEKSGVGEKIKFFEGEKVNKNKQIESVQKPVEKIELTEIKSVKDEVGKIEGKFKDDKIVEKAQSVQDEATKVDDKKWEGLKKANDELEKLLKSGKPLLNEYYLMSPELVKVVGDAYRECILVHNYEWSDSVGGKHKRFLNLGDRGWYTRDDKANALRKIFESKNEVSRTLTLINEAQYVAFDEIKNVSGEKRKAVKNWFKALDRDWNIGNNGLVEEAPKYHKDVCEMLKSDVVYQFTDVCVSASYDAWYSGSNYRNTLLNSSIYLKFDDLLKNGKKYYPYVVLRRIVLNQSSCLLWNKIEFADAKDLKNRPFILGVASGEMGGSYNDEKFDYTFRIISGRFIL